MWFGDLVTMKWWNDTWLKESFADVMCYYALLNIQSNLDYKISNIDSKFNELKYHGLIADQKITTHPINGIVANTEEAKQIFDSITYNKGIFIYKLIFFLILSC